METAKRVIRRQFSTGSIKHSRKFNFVRSLSFDPRLVGRVRFAFGRQSSLDPNRRLRSRSPVNEGLGVPDNLDNTMQLLFMASQGDAKAVEGLLKDGVDVNSIDLDGRTALHIAACEGHVAVAKLLLSWKANVDARDRWGSTVIFFSLCLVKLLHIQKMIFDRSFILLPKSEKNYKFLLVF